MNLLEDMNEIEINFIEHVSFDSKEGEFIKISITKGTIGDNQMKTYTSHRDNGKTWLEEKYSTTKQDRDINQCIEECMMALAVGEIQESYGYDTNT